MGVPILDKINVAGFSSSKNTKKALEEKSKLFGYIGMDIWDMKKEGKIDMPELDPYFEKLDLLEREVRELEEEKQKKGGAICACGRKVEKDMQFCPYCGTPVRHAPEQGMQKLDAQERAGEDQNAQANNFWQGTSSFGTTDTALKENARECICGAKIPEGQFMCMECGRKIE